MNKQTTLYASLMAILFAFCGINASTEISSVEFLAAAKNGDLETVKRYIDNGGDITVTNKKHKTALYYASAKGHVEIVELLLAQPNINDILNQKNHKGKTAYYKAITNFYKRLTAESIAQQLKVIILLDNAGATGANDKCYKGKTAYERLEERKSKEKNKQ